MTDTDAAEAVASRRREWMESVNARDVGRYTELVTRDLAWLPPTGEPVEGREAFREWIAPFFGEWEYDFRVEPARLTVCGDRCAELGHFVSRLTPADGGESQEHGGEYFVLWRLEDDGIWRIERYADVTPGGEGDRFSPRKAPLPR